MPRIKQTARKATGVAPSRWKWKEEEWEEPHAKVMKLKDPIMTDDYYCDNWIGRPIYYQPTNSNKQYLVITPRNVNRNRYTSSNKTNEDLFIIKYDIDMDEYINFAKIPETFPFEPVHFIDNENDKLYVFEYNHDVNPSVFVLDLITTEWIIYEAEEEVIEDEDFDQDGIDTISHTFTHSHTNRIFCPYVLFVNKEEDGIKEAHFLYCYHERGYHKIYDFEQKKFIDQDRNNSDLIKLHEGGSEWPEDGCFSPNMVYIKSQHKLMVIGASNDDKGYEYRHSGIWELDLMEKNGKWKLLDLTLPSPDLLVTEFNSCSVVLGFDSIIYLFCTNYKFGEYGSNIWCLDLYEMKWYKSNKNLPKYMMNDDIEGLNCYIETNNEYSHFYYPMSYPQKYHSKISLYDICPQIIKDDHKKRYHKLVFGFVRQYIDKTLNFNVPHYLITLILSYYTIFI